MGDVIMAWMLLWRAVAAAEKLGGNAKKKDLDFYEGQIKSAEFFIQNELPVTVGKMNSVAAMGKAAVEIEERAFGG